MDVWITCVVIVTTGGNLSKCLIQILVGFLLMLL